MGAASVRALALVAGSVLALTSWSGAQEALEWPVALQPDDSPAAAGSAQPQMTVSRRGVLLSWIERTGTQAALKFAERTPSGWSRSRAVATGDDWFLNWADVPSVLRLDDGTLAAHWLQKSGPETYAYDVRLAYSRDDGRTWSTSFSPHHDGTQTEHGFASLFQVPGGGLGVVWLDGRATASSGGHGAHGGGTAATALRAATFDRSWKQTSERVIADRVCDCCPTTAAVTSDGPIVAFRNRTADEVRDIYVSSLVKGTWSTASPVSDDGWKIAACPVNGPMISARGAQVAIAWFSVRDDVGHAYLAFSSAAGRNFGRPVRLDASAALGRVDVELLEDGSAVATWIELADGRAAFAARRVHPSRRMSPPVTVSAVSASRASGYPRVAWWGSELVLAWTEGTDGASRVRTAVARTPR